MASADQGIIREEVEYPSSDGKTQIKGLVWQLPEVASGTVPPRAVFQIVHGMAEHIARYDEFARYLARRGFVVCGEDHVGHGRTAAAADDLGHIPLEGGKDILLADVDGMRRLVDGRYDGCSTPYVLFGHSMGSFIARAYLPRHRPWVDAAILCGTGHPSKATSRLGNALAHLIARFKGERHLSKLLDRMGVGAYGKCIEGARTPLDWLCTDPAVVDAYRADPLCGAMFTVGGYAALTDLTEEVVDFMHAAPGYQVPVLFVSGWDDPVGGDWGKSMLTAAELLRAIGMRDVRTIRYKGMRHEILNEPGRAFVFADVAGWAEARLAARFPDSAAQRHWAEACPTAWQDGEKTRDEVREGCNERAIADALFAQAAQAAQTEEAAS